MVGTSLRCAGLVLCGGRSERMGSAKAWLPFGPELLLQRVVCILGEVVSPVVAVAAPGQRLPPLPAGVLIVRDAQEGRGPLEGMLAGVKALDGRADAVFVASCDAPLLSSAFVRRVLKSLGDQEIAAPVVDGFAHPLAAVYRLSLQGAIESMLAADQRRPTDLLRERNTRELTTADFADIDPEMRSLRGCNTPEEYQTLLREAGFA
ncbi:MAG: molybdenum cofactor guanylyltransferase [Planctomycetia bacterium]|nr:molybdenum cofactor guanylyltransferase [Planctomycetia bacterium]